MARFYSLANRFWKKVDKKGKDECWNWLGAINSSGYGSFGYNGRIISAPTMSCMINDIEIPEGNEVTHVCNNPKCVNPNHLKIDTHKGNMKYMVECGRGYICDNRGQKNNAAKLTENDIKEIRIVSG